MIGSADRSLALDVSLTGRADYTVSDNIERAPVGSEVSGTIWARTVGLGLLQNWGPKSLNILVEGGWETVDATTSTTEEVNRLRMDARLPWSSTGALAVSLEQSRETVPPDPEELNQGRQLTDRSRAGINLASRTSPNSGWEADLSARIEEREDRDLMESVSAVTWSTALDKIYNIELGAGLTNGEDAILENSWVEDQFSVVLNRQLSASSSIGYRLQWDGSHIEEADTGTGRSDQRSERIGAGATYQWQSSSLWQHVYGIHIDRVTTVSDEKYTEPRAQVSVSGGQLREATLAVNATYGTQLPDPLDDQATWSRNATFRTDISWAAARNLSLESAVSYRRSVFFLDDTLDREDVTTSAQVSMVWQPLELRLSFGLTALSVGLTALAEERHSSDETNDLNETRYGINLSGTIE